MASKETKAKAASRPRARAAKAKPKSSGGQPKGKRRQSNARLRPGQLNGLVLGYMAKHKDQLPITATGVAQGIKRSSGAVANCLVRLAEAKQVRLIDKKPRRYDLASSTK